MLSHLLTILFTISQLYTAQPPIVLQGKVYEAGTKKPLAYIHSYLKEGEEEDLTGRNGTFSIRTYSGGPYTITFAHPEYETLIVNRKKAGTEIEVFLRRKK